jgi:hypothetical protein
VVGHGQFADGKGTRWRVDTCANHFGKLTSATRTGREVNNAELDEYLTRIENSLGPDPSDEEIVEATTAAYPAPTKVERRRQSSSMRVWELPSFVDQPTA